MPFLGIALTFLGYALVYAAVAKTGRFAAEPWRGVFEDAYADAAPGGGRGGGGGTGPADPIVPKPSSLPAAFLAPDATLTAAGQPASAAAGAVTGDTAPVGGRASFYPGPGGKTPPGNPEAIPPGSSGGGGGAYASGPAEVSTIDQPPAELPPVGSPGGAQVWNGRDYTGYGPGSTVAGGSSGSMPGADPYATGWHPTQLGPDVLGYSEGRWSDGAYIWTVNFHDGSHANYSPTGGLINEYAAPAAAAEPAAAADQYNVYAHPAVSFQRQPTQGRRRRAA